MRLFKLIMKRIIFSAAVLVVVAQCSYFCVLLIRTVPFWPNADNYYALYYILVFSLLIILFGIPVVFAYRERLPLKCQNLVAVLWSIEFVCVISLGVTSRNSERYINQIMDCKDCDYNLAGFDLVNSEVTDLDVLNLMGEGCKAQTPEWYPGVQRLYLFPNTSICGVFDSAPGSLSITLSQMSIDGKCLDANATKIIQSIPKNKQKDCFSKKGLSDYATGKKLALGDSAQKTLMLYGKPTFIVKTNENNFLYSYQRSKGPVANMKVLFENNVVVSITVEHHKMPPPIFEDK